MARAHATLGVSLNAYTSKFDRKIRRSKKRVSAFSRSLARAGKSMLLFGGGVVGGALVAGRAFMSLGRRAEEFNQAMRSSLAIMGDVSEAMRKDMANAAITVASKTKVSSKEAAEAYFFLASAGLSATQSLQALPTVATFAQAGMFDMSRATDLLTDAQSALGLTVKNAQQNMLNMTRVGDVLVKANTLANASVQQFSEALTTKAGAALRILGKDVEEGVAVLAAFADQGIKASEAGTALNIVLRDLTTKANKNAAAFERAQVAVYDSTGDMRNLGDIIADLENTLDGLSDSQKKATLSQLGFADKSIIFIQSVIGMSDKIKEYEHGLRSAAGTMQDVADKQLTPWAKATNELSAAWDRLANSLSWVVDVLAGMASTLAGVIEGMLIVTKLIGGKGYLETMGEFTEKLGEQTGVVADNMARTADQAERALGALRRASLPDVLSRRAAAAGLERERIRIDVGTAQEQFEWGMNRLNRLFDYGQHDAETYGRAVAALQKTFDDATGKTERLAKAMQKQADAAR
ncbi:MAG: phage tail tape measure protein, partial [Planctomycetota bacterium]